MIQADKDRLLQNYELARESFNRIGVNYLNGIWLVGIEWFDTLFNWLY